jgi:hypothetical protein
MKSHDEALTEADLDAIDQRARAATGGPWYVRTLNDDFAAGLVAVSTSPDTGRAERWPDFAAAEMVAATLVQFPNRYIDCVDERWHENAAFIAHAREDVPRLLAEIRRLRAQVHAAAASGTPPPASA